MPVTILLDFYHNLFIMCVCVSVLCCVWGGDMHATSCMWRPEDNFGSQFSPLRGTQDQTRVIWLGGKAFYLLSHLTLVLILDVIFPKARERLRLQTTAWGHGHVGRGFSPGPLFSRKLTWATEKDRWGGDPPHHVRVDANLLSVEYLTRHLHSCLSKINPRVLLFED